MKEDYPRRSHSRLFITPVRWPFILFKPHTLSQILRYSASFSARAALLFSFCVFLTKFSFNHIIRAVHFRCPSSSYAFIQRYSVVLLSLTWCLLIQPCLSFHILSFAFSACPAVHLLGFWFNDLAFLISY
jgi:hypothetical protein